MGKGMSNSYLKDPRTPISGFKFFFTRPVFEELQLTQISLNFKTSSCNFKFRGLEVKLCVAFVLI